MSEPLLIPQHAQSLHPNMSEILTAWSNAFRQFASTVKEVMRNVARAIEEVMRPIVDWWRRITTQRTPRRSPQTRAFLRIVNGSKRHNEIHAKPRSRSVRRTYAEAILEEKPVAYYRLAEVSENIVHDESGNAHHATMRRHCE